MLSRLPGPRIRRGSEGYEVRPIDREQLLRESIEHHVAGLGRYNVYVPEDASEDEDEDECDDLEKELLAAEKVDAWRVHSSVTSTS